MQDADHICHHSTMERTSVTSCYHGSKFRDHNNSEHKQRRRRRQRERQNSNMFAWAKQQLCTCLCTFLSCRCMTATRNFLILTRPLYGVGEHNTHVFSLFLNLVLLDSTSENFANIWHTKWNWIRSMKFEIVRIHFPEFFKSDVFGLLSLRDFATMATSRSTC